LLHNVGYCEEAVKAFANATRIDPGDEISWKMMGVLLASKLYRYDEADQAFDSALMAKISPGNWRTWRDASRIVCAFILIIAH
jgi:hypothetical protein